EPPGGDAAVPTGCHLTGPGVAAAGPRGQADCRTKLGSVIAKVASPAMARASCTAFRASWRSSLCFQVAHQAGNLIGIRGEKLLGSWVSSKDAPGALRSHGWRVDLGDAREPQERKPKIGRQFSSYLPTPQVN